MRIGLIERMLRMGREGENEKKEGCGEEKVDRNGIWSKHIIFF